MKSTGSSYWLLLSITVLISIPEALNGFACLSNPCIHGVCLDDLNSTYFCYCIDGYTGIQCQTNWNECWSSPCKNGGTCIDGIAMFNCSCPAGYSGDMCEDDINECESNPCHNNGTCIDGQNGYMCNCLPGYSGGHCEMDIAVCNATNETRCSNGGICEEGPGESFSCRCRPGWGGFLCDTEIDECISAPCQNGAVCIDLHADYSCACLFGYTGRNCEETMHICDNNPCRNGALCLTEENRSICYCVPDFHGDLCQFQYDECQLGPRCMNGGTCIDGIDNFTCSCPPQLTGVLCECLILDDSTFDCTYVSPTPTTISYEFTTITSVPTVMSRTTFSPTSSETTKVPTTELIPRTDKPEFNQSQETFSVTEVTVPITSTLYSTSEQTVITIENISETVTTTKFSSPVFSTSLIPFPTATESTLLTTLGFTTELITQVTEVPESTKITNITLSTEPTTTETTSDLTTVYSTKPTVPEEIKTSESYHPVITVPSTITSVTPTTFSIETTTLPQNITSFTTKDSEEITTTIEPTIKVTETTIKITTATSKDFETNRTFPEETTTFPSVSTFFTTEPTKMELSTLLTTSTGEITTTFSPEETTFTTTLSSIDCTRSDTPCQHGGTCVFTGFGHKCLCPFDSEGALCEIKLGIRNAAFNGQSYLSHRLVNVSHVLIEFDAKTMANSGLLFFTSIDSTYMGLYIQDGHLKFVFSCGFQTMLLSELKNSVNNGYPMKIRAEIQFSNDFKHCDAAIKVNNSLSMTGDQIAKKDIFMNPTAWLYLGGLPQDMPNYDIVPVGGFIGCMSSLKISGKRVNIYKEAEDGQEITECSSLACLSNPCSNGGSCTSIGEKWQCHCQNGYLGKNCDISICDNNPCLFGGTCIPFTNTGYICLCPFGKHGHFCENDLKITEPYFSSTVRGLSSFVAYPFPDGISRTMELKFRFTPTTMEQISLLLFIGQPGHHDFYSDHLAVSFVKGYIMLTWNLGSGPRRIFTSQPIKKGERDYLVRLGHAGRKAWLYVEHLGNITGRSPGNLIQLDVVPLLFIGGHYSRNFSHLPHDLPLHAGFSGCIFDVEMKSGSVVIPFQGSLKTFGRAVGQCGITECYERSCQNGGACLHHGSTFMCLCQDNWYGPLCSSRNNVCDNNYTKCSEDSRCIPLISNYECDCPAGKTGTYCEKTENITDVSLTGKRSYIALYPVDIDNSKFHIEMELRTLRDQGIIFFMGKEDSSFVSLSLSGGLLELRIQTSKYKTEGKTSVFVRSSKLLVRALWYKIKFGLFGRKVYLSVDSVINTGVLDIGQIVAVSKEPIFIGGLPDMSKFPLTAFYGFPIPYTGCIRHLSIDDNLIPLITTNIQSSRNVIDCDGTPCGGETCLNGGTCWLDSFMKPHCSCVSPYYGEKCELVPDCDGKTCRNGRCLSNRCICKPGWNGVFCETEIRVKLPEFTGKSYLIVKKVSDKKRALKNVELKNVKLNFTTAKPDGLLLWSRKDDQFVGIGLEKGFLKLAYSIDKSNKSIIEVPSYVQLADGLQHSIEITFNPISLKIDGKPTANKWDNMSNITIMTNEIFLIGGIPTNTSLIQETNGLFPYAFNGCVEEFGSNQEYITDFSRFEGSNINECKFFL